MGGGRWHSMHNTFSLLLPPLHTISLLWHWSFHGLQSFWKNLHQCGLSTGVSSFRKHPTAPMWGSLWAAVWTSALAGLLHMASAPAPWSTVTAFPSFSDLGVPPVVSYVYFFPVLPGVFCLSLNVVSSTTDAADGLSFVQQ